LKEKILITALCIALNISSYGGTQAESQTEDYKKIQNETETKEDKGNYAEKYEREEYGSMSSGKKIFYGGMGIATAVGIVLAADSISTDSDGTKVEIGDPPPEEENLMIRSAVYSVESNNDINRDLGRTTLQLKDISTTFREIGREAGGRESINVFVRPLDRRGEYNGVIAGVYLLNDIWSYGDLDIRGSLAYGHSTADYEDGSDGSSETLHCALHLNYERDRIRSYTWLANEYSYNRFEDGETARYKSSSYSLGSEGGYVFGRKSLEVVPFFFVEGGYIKREGIDLKGIQAESDDYNSFEWGPGVEVKSKGVRGLYSLSGSVRAVYRMQEGNIYDEVKTSSGSVEKISEDDTLELSVTGDAGRDGIFISIGGSYYIQDGDNYFSGRVGAGYDL